MLSSLSYYSGKVHQGFNNHCGFFLEEALFGASQSGLIQQILFTMGNSEHSSSAEILEGRTSPLWKC